MTGEKALALDSVFSELSKDRLDFLVDRGVSRRPASGALVAQGIGV